MVFGNMGQDSGTGVLTTRDVSSGNPSIEGDFLINAQGEDVVSGTRQTMQMSDMKAIMPIMYEQLEAICHQLENYYRETQDIEFTVERGTLWMLQTRNAKRTAQAAMRIAVDMAEEGLISETEAVHACPARRRLLPASAVRHQRQEGRHGPRRIGRQRSERLARRGRGPGRLRRRHRRALGQG
jgi:phosphoenolpyruvate synthase/pyruvate phosphate dikinase